MCPVSECPGQEPRLKTKAIQTDSLLRSRGVKQAKFVQVLFSAIPVNESPDTGSDLQRTEITKVIQIVIVVTGKGPKTKGSPIKTPNQKGNPKSENVYPNKVQETWVRTE